MAGKKKTYSEEDIAKMYEMVYDQIQENRVILLDQQKEIRLMLSGSVDRYVVAGDILAKLSDILVKSTGQSIEFLKTVKTDAKETNDLTEEDILKISQALK